MNQDCTRFPGGGILLEGGSTKKINESISVPLLWHTAQLDHVKNECDPNDVLAEYKQTPIPKAYLNITTFGHCDILNDGWWLGCYSIQACHAVIGTDRKQYR
eukprot:UN24381